MTSDLLKLPKPLRARVQSELQVGERVVYAGMPNWRAETGKHIIVFLFGAGWSAIIFPLTAMLVLTHFGVNDTTISISGLPASSWGRIGLIIFMFPFVLIGLLMLLAPFFGIIQSRRTVHVVTDKRIMNVIAAKRGVAESYPLSTITFTKRKERKDGTGDLEIGYGIGRDLTATRARSRWIGPASPTSGARSRPWGCCSSGARI